MTMDFVRPEPLGVRSDEAAFLRVARVVMGLSPLATALEVLLEKHRRVDLSENAIAALKDILAKGTVLALVRNGGHAVRRSLRGDGTVSPKGRLWERHAPIGLFFSGATMAVLRHVHEHSLIAPAPDPHATTRPLSAADHLVHLLAADACKRAVAKTTFVGGPWQASPLVAIAFPVESDRAAGSVDYGPLLSGPGAVVVEALRERLATRVCDAERERRTSVASAIAGAGRAFAAGPAAFVAAAIAKGRPDLGLFILDGVSRILEERRRGGPAFWAPRAAKNASLAERQAMARGVVPVLEAALSYRAVLSRARAVGFVDDDYDAAQAILEELQTWDSPSGDFGGSIGANQRGFDKVQGALRELSSFDGESGIVGGTP